jgi:hypothetical protein
MWQLPFPAVPQITAIKWTQKQVTPCLNHQKLHWSTHNGSCSICEHVVTLSLPSPTWWRKWKTHLSVQNSQFPASLNILFLPNEILPYSVFFRNINPQLATMDLWNCWPWAEWMGLDSWQRRDFFSQKLWKPLWH